VQLERDGFKVSVAATGNIALSTALRNPHDLVILDIGLPDSDGLDICRALQDNHPALRVIFLTARSSDVDKVSGLALGDGYVTKPFSIIELEARIGMVLRRTRAGLGAAAVPVEIGHSSCTVCNLGNIACQLKRTIKWNPATETFVDDTDGAATKLMHYEYRKGWKLV